MQSAKDIKRRIQGIGNIMQITNAMQLVASAKLRKARTRLENTKPYIDTVYENINSTLANIDEISKLMEVRDVKKRAILVIASDKGLAGGYNSTVVKEAINNAKENSNAENIIYTTGIRSIDLIKSKGYEPRRNFLGVDDSPTIEDSYIISRYFIDEFLKEEYDEVVVATTDFKSVISQQVRIIKLLPANGFKVGKEFEKLDYTFDSSPKVVLEQMIRQYINVVLYGCLLESSVSEHASRRMAMENATSNGKELLEDLELIYNRARQASITQEITEIVGGAEALN